MKEKLGEHPSPIEELQDLIRELTAKLEAEHAEKIEYQHEALKHFEEIQLLRRRIFGRRTEKLSEEDRRQLLLFNEAEQILLAQASQPPEKEESVEVHAHRRRKPGRKALPADLPRVETIHDLSEEEKRCACGQRMVRIRQKACEKFEIIPARIRVRRLYGPYTPAMPAKALAMRVGRRFALPLRPRSFCPRASLPQLWWPTSLWASSVIRCPSTDRKNSSRASAYR